MVSAVPPLDGGGPDAGNNSPQVDADNAGDGGADEELEGGIPNVELACGDDSVGCAPSDTGSQLTVSVTAGTTYYLFLDAKAGAGSWKLKLMPPPQALAGGPGGGTCSSGSVAIDPRGGVYTGTLSGMSTATGCSASGEATYRYDPAAPGVQDLTVTAGPGSTSVSIKGSIICGSGTCESGPSVTIRPNVSGDYYFLIDGDADGGEYTLAVTSASEAMGSVPNRCTSPRKLGAGGGVYGGTSAAADAMNAGSCGGAAGKESVFSWVPSVSGTWTIDTCGSSIDTVLYLRTTCS